MISLRIIQPNDLDLIYKWLNDADLYRKVFLSTGTVTIGDVSQYLSHDILTFLILYYDQPIGWTLLAFNNRLHPHIGITIANPEFRGRGIGTDIIKRHQTAIKAWNYEGLRGLTLASNEAMRRVFLKCGFREGGYERTKLSEKAIVYVWDAF